MEQQVMLANYRDVLNDLPSIMSLTKEQLLIDELHIQDLASLKLYYAPHNDVIYKDAKLIIAGLTPGFHQMRLALAAAQAAIWEGEDDRTACYRAKQQARFAGSMRKHLIAMMDGLGIQHWLKLDSCEQLFEDYAEWLHTTSIIRYPAFIHGRNYSGAQPNIMNNEAIRTYALEHMKEQVSLFTHKPIIPLGRSVEALLRLLVEQGIVEEEHILWGFPHPSGANGHRHRQYAQKQNDMMKQIERWKYN